MVAAADGQKPQADFDNYYDLATRSGRPYVDFPVEFPIGAGQVIKGWDNGLLGQKVGSRVLLVIPPADGYGDAGQGETIKGDDTLVFVVDILAAY